MSHQRKAGPADVVTPRADEPITVAYIDPLGHHGGHHYYTDQLARGLVEAGIDVEVYGLAGESLCAKQTVYPFRQTFRGIFGSDPTPLRGLRFLRGLLLVALAVLRRRPSIVHVNVWQWSVRELLQVLLARALGRRIVLTIHDVETFGATTSGARRRLITRAASGAIVHNDYSRSKLPAELVRDLVVVTIPHVSHAAYLSKLPSRAQARHQLDLPADRTILLFFGNPRHEKGLDLAIEAFARLRDHEDLFLLTGGRIPEEGRAHFGAMMRDLGLDGRMRMDTDTIPDELAFSYYAAADLVLVPYRVVYESGVSIMAASCGRAIIASDLPVLTELADHGRSGLLFRSEDVADMAAVIERALGPDVDPDALGAHAREVVLRDRSSSRIGRLTKDFYRTVLEA